MHIKDNTEAALWMARFQTWCTGYEAFLKERNDKGGYVHERLRKARRALTELCNAGMLFTYLEEEIAGKGIVSSTSNKIENLNGRIRRVLSLHCGMNIDHRIKAVFWFCCMESESPISPARMLKEFPTDDDIRRWRFEAAKQKWSGSAELARWGEGIVWSEFRHSTPYPYQID